MDYKQYTKNQILDHIAELNDKLIECDHTGNDELWFTYNASLVEARTALFNKWYKED